MANGRCRSHGGTSTGPRTEAGLAARRANAIVLLNDGWSCAAVAAAQLIDDDSVRSWHKLYAEHGLVAPHSISISSPYP
jgi:transposase